MSDDLRLLSIREAAEETGLSVKRLEQLKRDGKLHFMQFAPGGRVYFRLGRLCEDLEALETVPV